MALIPMEKQNSIETILAAFSNASAVTIAKGATAFVQLSTSTDLTGYIPVGILSYNTYEGGGNNYLAVKAFNATANTYTINIENTHPTDSITIPIGKVLMSVRMMKLTVS